MLTWLIRNRLAAFERRYGYDATYAHDILAADRGAFLRLAKLSGLGAYRGDAPRDAYWAAKLIGTTAEDCGPCTQLVVAMALEAGATPAVLAATLRGDDGALPEDVRLAVRFARAALAHAPDADGYREQIAARWGQRAVIAIAFGLAAARVYPTIKYALGHGKACLRVHVDGEPVAVARSAA